MSSLRAGRLGSALSAGIQPSEPSKIKIREDLGWGPLPFKCTIKCTTFQEHNLLFAVRTQGPGGCSPSQAPRDANTGLSLFAQVLLLMSGGGGFLKQRCVGGCIPWGRKLIPARTSSGAGSGGQMGRDGSGSSTSWSRGRSGARSPALGSIFSSSSLGRKFRRALGYVRLRQAVRLLDALFQKRLLIKRGKNPSPTSPLEI